VRGSKTAGLKALEEDLGHQLPGDVLPHPAAQIAVDGREVAVQDEFEALGVAQGVADH
jgi:hypothetical protein